MFVRLLFGILLPVWVFAGKISYTVDFIGLDDAATLKTLKNVSDLTTLQQRPPASINALRYRAESDIPELIKVLHAHGYYEATVNIRIEELVDNTVQVFVMIQSGPVYTIDEYKIYLFSGTHENTVACPVSGMELGKPALAKEILNEELKTLALLSDCGYPLATVEKREMIVDGKTKTMHIRLEIQTGPCSCFGPTEITGLTSVKRRFIEHRTEWKAGDCYKNTSVENTQKTLMDTGLFSSLLITHAEKIDPSGCLPMKIEVKESKHRSVNLGVSYQTFFGPGITFGWEHRNISGMGRKLTLQGDATRKTHTGSATFLVPDFYRIDQDYVVQAQAMNENIYTYAQRSYLLTNRIERRIDTRYRMSVGAKLERLLVSESIDNGHFNLLEIPLYFRWSSANNLLNPTKGVTIEYKAVPSINFSNAQKYYLYQAVTQSVYWPVTKSHVLVLAQQVMFETILSKNLDAVPVPKRVLGGTDLELRGYRYRTVSPLGPHHQPKGGRSGIFYTFEPRLRVSKTIGLVPFFDIGNVYTTVLPKFKDKWFKSVGLGIRYFTFLGPLRFDIAFPLDRRKPIDPRYRVLVSIGQTF